MDRVFNDWMKEVPNDEITIISGTAKGADRLGERIAEDYDLKLIRMPADWNTHGKAAGYVRNKDMAEIATHALIFWDGESRGTKHMIILATQYKLLTVVERF
jgi:hypothetical protein